MSKCREDLLKYCNSILALKTSKTSKYPNANPEIALQIKKDVANRVKAILGEQ